MSLRVERDSPQRWLIGGMLVLALAAVARADDEPVETQGNAARVAALRQYALKHKGDAMRGKRLFEATDRVRCLSCHKARGKGGDIGPDLTDIGNKFDRPLLIESVLEPSRQIVEGYRVTTVSTTTGRVLAGLVRGETDTELTLIAADGARHQVARSEIDELRVTNSSPMPDNVTDGLTSAEFADLIAYLESLRPGRSPTPGERSSGAFSLPRGFRAIRVAEGLTGATCLAALPDGRVLVGEQTGTVRVVKDDRLLREPVLRLEVDSQWERGLIGMALDPRFHENGYLYVCRVLAAPYPHHRVSRFTVTGDRAAPDSERVLLEGDDQTKLGGNVPAGHQGGALHFGRDGCLYVALGEQTAGAPAQDLHSLLGKLLRINADGTIPADNPFLEQTTGKYRAIWARGLRNPFTFAVQPETGRIFINDVGGNAEEVDEGVAGANYGWPLAEHGPTRDPRFVGPIHWYPTASISGAAFCPLHGPEPHAGGGGYPDVYRGKYFFMDFVRGWIRVLNPDDPARPAVASTFATGLPRPVDLTFAADGSLLVLLRDAWVRDDHFRASTGVLLRIRYQGGD